MNTLVDFRRKLLSFDRPLYHDYVRSSLPRHYSSFFRSYTQAFPQIHCWNQSPEWYPIAYPLLSERRSNKLIDLSTYPKKTNVYGWMIIVLIIVMCLFILKL